MAVVAPFSKFKLKNLKIYIGACVVVAVILAYDGYLSKYQWSKRYSFYQEHVIDNDGVPDGTMVFNQVVPGILVVLGVLLWVRLLSVKDRKLVADESGLVTGRRTVAYEKIETIDKTHFDSKGYFIIMYKDGQGKNGRLKLSDRTYDNLPAVLDELIAGIT